MHELLNVYTVRRARSETWRSTVCADPGCAGVRHSRIPVCGPSAAAAIDRARALAQLRVCGEEQKNQPSQTYRNIRNSTTAISVTMFILYKVKYGISNALVR
ncbi:hypothetical protein EVAR_43057_1 [Eumeta japonica]|uniref:Uncharacterized protein n=1 Tax=Eumeta variegata TaxID=151549 RepID=A0A4C1WWL7_EUMVA|nr:hypothetical protein EVAR_43057_1 [Eumeta japonica]